MRPSRGPGFHAIQLTVTSFAISPLNVPMLAMKSVARRERRYRRATIADSAVGALLVGAAASVAAYHTVTNQCERFAMVFA